MNKEFIPYEQALELKELGFDEDCLGVYFVPTKGLHYGSTKQLITQYTEEVRIPAPLYSQAFRWFRERYLLHHEIVCGDNVFWIRYGKNRHTSVLSFDTNRDIYWLTYEEAELACLKKLIEIVKNN